MVESRASYRYAKAIIDHARHTGAIEETVADFATLEQAFCRFGPPEGHVTIDLTVSANSPSTA